MLVVVHQVKDPSAEVCLDLIKKAFVEWRYMYEHDRLSIDLTDIRFMLETLARACKELLDSKKLS